MYNRYKYMFLMIIIIIMIIIMIIIIIKLNREAIKKGKLTARGAIAVIGVLRARK